MSDKMNFLFQVKPRLRCILRSCSCSTHNMAYWLTVPEFADAIESLLDQGIYISDDVVLPIMEEIYQKKVHACSRKTRSEQIQQGIMPDFMPRIARNAINQIKKAHS